MPEIPQIRVRISSGSRTPPKGDPSMVRIDRRIAVAAGSLLIAVVSLAPQAAFAQAPTVDSVVDHLTQALGGRQAWDNTHYIRFNFLGRRTHWWDKWTGRHRLEGDTKEKQHYVVIENVNTKEG